ncbi:DUF4336 domain-containing protein [Photobacterium ganghwense]|uniref:DUF4336 domain-containing protein n=1 Tax=Photobacterium ganghwense TaxID=320778 RepID=UPI0039EF6038
MEALDERIWIADGGTVPFFTLPYSTRITVVKLDDGSLWIHSPIKLSADLYQALNELGDVRYLIAPNHLHHLFLEEWQTAFPQADTYGTQEVIAKRQDLSFTGELVTKETYPWSQEIHQVLFTGSPVMQECVFFHSPSQTLIVTDLIENFSPDAFNAWQRILAKGTGILAPNGKMPIDWRLSFMCRKQEARAHMLHILAWQPKRIVLAHGEIIRDNATAFLKHSFSWLKV